MEHFLICWENLGKLTGDLCRFNFSKADDNLMLFGKGASEVGDVERDVEVTSALLKVEKKKRLKASALCW